MVYMCFHEFEFFERKFRPIDAVCAALWGVVLILLLTCWVDHGALRQGCRRQAVRAERTTRRSIEDAVGVLRV